MSMELIFWIIMLIWLLFYGFAWYWPHDPRIMWAPNIVLWVLLALLGWKVFGPMIHG